MTTTTAGRPNAALLEWLRGHGVDYEVHQHDEAYTALTTARAEGVDARTFAKVVGVAADDGRTAIVVMDAPDHVDLRKARSVLGAREVRLLTEPELSALAPDCEAGAIPAVGALFGQPMFADYAIQDDDEISFNAGTHRCSVRVDRAAWEHEAGVRYGDLAGDRDSRPAWAAS